MRLAELSTYLDSFLRVRAIADWPGAFNGLQVENRGEVSRVAAAVDACQAVIDDAAAGAADLLLVHHGLFWRETRPLTGTAYRRVAALVRAEVAVYAAHLPLDVHPEVGNNAELARRLGMRVAGWWGEHEGTLIGVHGELDVERDTLSRQLVEVLGTPPRLLPFGPPRCRRVGIVTGGSGSLIAEAAAAGLDTFISGEGQHWTYLEAEELGVNVYFAGHYSTETLGVRALAAHLEQRFGLTWWFIDHPSGM